MGCLSATWEHEHHPIDSRGRLPPSHDIGDFSKFLCQKRHSIRTQHPVFSITFNRQKGGQELKSRLMLTHKYAFGPLSPWHSMLENQFKIVIIGLPGIEKLTLIHHIEQLCGVPYVYNKLIMDKDDTHYYMSVPYQNMEVIYANQVNLETKLSSAGIIKKHSLKWALF
ncbi:AAC(3) family N-acetyltransferase [Martelella alba]|nr:AAC(3) family N-acetyltransferase [Martelella alba]